MEWLDAQQGRQYELHERHISPAFVKMLRTVGFDKKYVRGEGSWLFDAEGRRYVLAGLDNIRGSAWKTVRKLTRSVAAEFVR